MSSKITFLLLFLGAGFNVFSQQTTPYWYDNAITLTGNPSGAEEYSYDYDTGVKELVKNHSFKYDANGKLLEHMESNEGIATFFQTFRYRFQYDTKGRLIYYWDEQEKMDEYESTREEQWVYDSYDMLTEYNNWSVFSGTKYLGGNSTQRAITREGSGKVTKIEFKDYSTVNEAFEIVKYWDFKYKVTGELDSIIIYEKNITLGGIMQLIEKRYNFNEKTSDYKNTDLLKFNSYVSKDYNDNIITTTITYDSENRVTKIVSGEASESYTYEEDKTIHIENDYKKTITYLDESGEEVKVEFYYYNENTDTWDLEWKASQIVSRKFDSGKIVSQLIEVLDGEEYRRETRFDFSYAVTNVLKKTDFVAISVYPNPTNAGFRLSEEKDLSGSVLEMTDLTGSKVYETILESGGEMIEPMNLISGIYFLKVTKGEMVYRSKVQFY